MKVWWQESTSVRDHRGRWERQPVLKALAEMRISPANSRMVVQYLCEGKGTSDFDCTRQQVYARVRKVVDKLVGT